MTATERPDRSAGPGGPPVGRQPSAIHNALSVLEEVARAGPGVTAKELSRALGLAPATTYRLVNQLVAEEYLVRLPDLRGFTLGRKVIELAGAVAPVRLPGAAADALAGLRSRVRLAINLVAYRRGRLVLLDGDPDHPPTSDAVLSRNPHASAFGKLLLAEHGDWRPLVGGGGRPRPVTPRTIADPDALERELDQVRDEGVARQSEELRPGRACLAFPVRDASGVLVAGLAVSGSPDRITTLEAPILGQLRDCAIDLSGLLPG
jgi:DNA-binding IclR family transcriptional regulator